MTLCDFCTLRQHFSLRNCTQWSSNIELKTTPIIFVLLTTIMMSVFIQSCEDGCVVTFRLVFVCGCVWSDWLNQIQNRYKSALLHTEIWLCFHGRRCTGELQIWLSWKQCLEHFGNLVLFPERMEQIACFLHEFTATRGLKTHGWVRWVISAL